MNVIRKDVGGAALVKTTIRFPKTLCTAVWLPTRCCWALSEAQRSTATLRIFDPNAGLLMLRQQLGVFANLRPAIIFDSLEDGSPLKK